MASVPSPEVEVRRSKRRRRTVSAYRDGDRIVVMIPASLSRKEEAEWVQTMVARLDEAFCSSCPFMPSLGHPLLIRRLFQLCQHPLDPVAR